MRAEVKAVLGNEKYYTEVVAGKNTLYVDEPEAKGGANKAFNPLEVLASSLASCTAVTLRMYAENKGWDVDEIKVEVIVDKTDSHPASVFYKEVSFGNTSLSEEQKVRLLKVAEACPIHKILANPIELYTKIV
jgi:osmC family protein